MNENQNDLQAVASKLLYLLEELKENFSEELLTQVLNCYYDEVDPDTFLGQDADKLMSALNGQHEKFYDNLALRFVENMNYAPEMYFLDWETIIFYFNNKSKNQFFKAGLEIAGTTDAADYINGIKYLESENLELANIHFSRIESYVANFFKGLVYFQLESYENAIKCDKLFLNGLNNVIESSEEEYPGELSETVGIQIVLWDIHNELGYLYNIVNEYKKAKYHFEKSLEIFNIESAYISKSEYKIDENIDDFTVWANNYMWALEKTGEKHKAKEILDFVVGKYPSNEYFRKKHKEFEKAHPADDIIKQIFAPKKPFNINKHEQVRLFSKEKSLEDMLIEQIKYGYHVFNRPFEVYNDKFYGRQYFIQDGYGILDLLLVEKSTDTLYLVELKRDQAGLEVVTQTERYIEGLTKELDREVKGIICLHRPNAEITQALYDKPHIELFTYQFDFVKQ